jgi:hypothetical protein
MDSIILSSVNLGQLKSNSPLIQLGRYIQLDFEGYDEGNKSSYLCSVLLDTETNTAVKHPDSDTESFKFTFTKVNSNIVLFSDYEKSSAYESEYEVSGTGDNRV